MIWSKLIDSHTANRQVLQPVREFRKQAIELMTGKYFTKSSGARSQPINLIESAQTVYRAHLSGDCPQCTVTTSDQSRRAKAYASERAMNAYVEKEIGLADIHERWVIDAILSSVAVVQVGVTAESIENLEHKVELARIYVDNVSLDDYVFDTAATRREDRQFVGNHFSVPLDRFKELGILAPASMKRLRSSERTGHNETGDERTENMTDDGGNRRLKNRVYEMLELWQLWLPAEGKIAVFQCDDNLSITDKEPLYTTPYVGPYCGPYHELYFQTVPDLLLGLPPVALWRDLHEIVNVVYRKLDRQAKRQKTNIVFQGSTEEDVKRHVKAIDGEAIRAENPQAIKEVSTGGANSANYAFMQDARQMFDWQAGSPNALGGLTQLNDTARQDEMQRESASVRINDMRRKVRMADVKLFRAIGWHMQREPSIQPDFTVEGPAGVTIQDRYTPEMRDEDGDYDYDVDPSSINRPTPEQRIAEIDDTFDRIMKAYQTLGPASQVVPSVPGYLKIRARYRNFKDLNELVTFPADQGSMPNPQNARTMPSETTRRYERVSSSVPQPENPIMEMMLQEQPAGVM